jgi:hypothetical protein
MSDRNSGEAFHVSPGGLVPHLFNLIPRWDRLLSARSPGATSLLGAKRTVKGHGGRRRPEKRNPCQAVLHRCSRALRGRAALGLRSSDLRRCSSEHQFWCSILFDCRCRVAPRPAMASQFRSRRTGRPSVSGGACGDHDCRVRAAQGSRRSELHFPLRPGCGENGAAVLTCAGAPWGSVADPVTRTPESFTAELGMTAGDRLPLKVCREKKSHAIRVTLGPRLYAHALGSSSAPL